MDINIKNIFDDSEIDIDKKIKNDNVEKESIKKDQDENTFNIENILLEKKNRHTRSNRCRFKRKKRKKFIRFYS